MSTFVPLSSRLRLCLRRTECDLPVRWLSVSQDSNGSTADIDDVRKSRLHHHLEELGVRADDLEDAYIKSVTTSEGYSKHFGKPAIKAYKSYFKQKAGEDIDVAANRFARQIDCESDQSELVSFSRHCLPTLDKFLLRGIDRRKRSMFGIWTLPRAGCPSRWFWCWVSCASGIPATVVL